MSIVSNVCARDIYRILADDKKNNGVGVELGQIKKQLLTLYPDIEIAARLGEMDITGVVTKGWARSEDGRWRMKYKVGDQTEWSALFARALGYDPSELGIPEYLANL